MRVQELMTKSVVGCRTTDTLNDAARIMWEADCGCVPVLDDQGKPIGMITDRDICMATYTQGKPPFAISVSSVMSQAVVTCRVDDTVANAESLMRQHQLRRLPVVDASGSVAGILSLNDIATHAQVKQAANQDELGGDAIARTLAAICAKGTVQTAYAE